MKHFNDLTPGEHERLSCALEEMGEAIQIIGKILRHGYNSHNPISDSRDSNRRMLTQELSHVKYSIDKLLSYEDISRVLFIEDYRRKEISIKKWLHHDGEL